jgi:hypothetical protein
MSLRKRETTIFTEMRRFYKKLSEAVCINTVQRIVRAWRSSLLD